MPAAREAIAAAPTNDVAFAGDDIADVKVADVGPDLDDAADELMPDDERHGMVFCARASHL